MLALGDTLGLILGDTEEETLLLYHSRITSSTLKARLGLGLADALEEGLILAEVLRLMDEDVDLETLELTLGLTLLLCDMLALTLGLIEGETEDEIENDEDILGLMLREGETEKEGDMLGLILLEGLTLRLTLREGLILGLTELDLLTLRLTEDDTLELGD